MDCTRLTHGLNVFCRFRQSGSAVRGNCSTRFRQSGKKTRTMVALEVCCSDCFFNCFNCLSSVVFSFPFTVQYKTRTNEKLLHRVTAVKQFNNQTIQHLVLLSCFGSPWWWSPVGFLLYSGEHLHMSSGTFNPCVNT